MAKFLRLPSEHGDIVINLDLIEYVEMNNQTEMLKVYFAGTAEGLSIYNADHQRKIRQAMDGIS